MKSHAVRPARRFLHGALAAGIAFAAPSAVGQSATTSSEAASQTNLENLGAQGGAANQGSTTGTMQGGAPLPTNPAAPPSFNGTLGTVNLGGGASYSGGHTFGGAVTPSGPISGATTPGNIVPTAPPAGTQGSTAYIDGVLGVPGLSL